MPPADPALTGAILRPRGQLTASQGRASRCPIPGCGDQIDPSRLMCRHWHRVPKQLRDQVWATWRSGHGALSREHQDAVRIAMATCQNSPARWAARQLPRARALPSDSPRRFTVRRWLVQLFAESPVEVAGEVALCVPRGAGGESLA